MNENGRKRGHVFLTKAEQLDPGISAGDSSGLHIHQGKLDPQSLAVN